MSGAAAERKQLAAREKKATDAEREKIEKILKPKRIAPGLEVGPLTDKNSPTMKSPLTPRKLDPIEGSPKGSEKKPVGKKKEKFDPSGPPSPIQSHPELRDPMTTVFSFLENPSPLHRTCWFLLECYEHSHYLEIPQLLPYLTRLPALSGKQSCPKLSKRRIPCLWSRINQLGAVCRKEKTEASKPGAAPSLRKSGTVKETPYKLHVVHLGQFSLNLVPSSIQQLRIAKCPITLIPKLSTLEQHGPSGLQELVLEDMPALQDLEIPRYCCRAMKLKNLPALQTLGHARGSEYTFDKDKLEKLTMEGLPELRTIKNSFLRRSAITSIRIVDLPKLEVICSDFAGSCENLKEVILQDLPSLKRIEATFLFCPRGDASVLTGVTFKNLPQLTTVGRHCMFGLHSLETVVGFNKTNLPSLTLVEGEFLNGCEKLTKFQLTGFPLLQTVDHNFLSNCPKLKDVTISDCPQLTKLGAAVMSHCDSLAKVRLANLPKLTSFQSPFCETGKKINPLTVTVAADVPQGIVDELEDQVGIRAASPDHRTQHGSLKVTRSKK